MVHVGGHQHGHDLITAFELGAAEIQGVQSTGVMAQVKHFAVYNQAFTLSPNPHRHRHPR